MGGFTTMRSGSHVAMVYSRASHDDSASIKMLRRLLAYDFGNNAKHTGGLAALHDETIWMQLVRSMKSHKVLQAPQASQASETPVSGFPGFPGFGVNLRFIDSETGVPYVTLYPLENASPNQQVTIAVPEEYVTIQI